MQSIVNDIIVSLVSWMFDVILKYQDSKSKSQLFDDTPSFSSLIYMMLVLSLNKTFSLIDTDIVKNFTVFKKF